jgi:peroxiredoxin Q/BCP
MPRPSIGDPAPDFEAPDSEGEPVRLSEHRGKAVVLYFYPKDETPGCTREACSFRDSYEDFVEAGATVIGVSADDAASHRSFAQNHHLPFVLLSDLDGSIRKAYGVKPSAFGLIPGRVTFVIDGDGVIRHVFESQLLIGRHVSDALAVVQSLAKDDRSGQAEGAEGNASV